MAETDTFNFASVAALPASPTPEPGSLTLLSLGLASFGAIAWMKKRKANAVAV